ncbi:MAG: hypothetical protein H6707_08900 [Deltaproteobacteria bacterium]|nr:hypothetical protein [Deltaproteobacteria bacterium]
MCRCNSSALARAILLSLSWLVTSACGLRVTNERPSYDQLEATEKSVVQRVLAELQSFNKQVESRTDYSVRSILGRDNIHVSFDGLIFVGTLGDNVVHVSPWENLSASQRTLIRSWFGSASADAARQTYEALFYRFFIVSQGVKQFMFEVHSPTWIYGNRSLFNVERDSIRAALSYYRDSGQRGMWDLTEKACAPLIRQYDALYSPNFNKYYMRDNFRTLADPQAPTGYMYFLCRFVRMGRDDSVDFTYELTWLRDLPKQ